MIMIMILILIVRLKELSTILCKDFQGVVPSREDQLESLPGVVSIVIVIIMILITTV